MDSAKKQALTQALERAESAILTMQEILQSNSTPTLPSIQTTPSLQISQPKPIPSKSKRVAKNRKNIASSLPAEDLSPAPDITDENWPDATHPNFILTDKGDVEKQFRALQIANIINQMDIDYKDKRVLDVGCGEGHITYEIAQHAAFTLGFDIIHDNSWDDKDDKANDQGLNCSFSSDPLFVENQNKFDVVVLFDVLDHVIKTEPGDLLKWCANLLTDDGIIFVHFHPWTSRHGGHLYDQLNKAFIHLVFTPDELAQMDVSVTEVGAKANQRVVRPLSTYKEWIEKAGLVIKERIPRSVEVEPFFESLLPRMNEVSWAGRCDGQTITKILQTESINYTLTK